MKKDEDSVFAEPHLQSRKYAADPLEGRANGRIGREARRESDDDRVERSVWDEPALAGAGAGPPPPDALTYRRWLAARKASTSTRRTWLVALCVTAVAGVWAVLGTLATGLAGGLMGSLLAPVLVGPIVEEVMKIALPLWIVEKRPFLFGSRGQIAVVAVASGLAFAAVENLLYLNVYVPQPSPELVTWRWTVCVALHIACTAIAAVGVARIWSRTMRDRAPPQVAWGAPFLVTAIVVHGTYNALAMGLSWLHPF